MNARDEIVRNFGGAAKTYDKVADIQRVVAKELVRRIHLLRPPSTLLDIGCGTGLVTEMLARRWPCAEITALDASPEMLSRLKEKLPNAVRLEADAATYSTEKKFDLVVSSMLLHWLSEPQRVIAHWRSLLATGGTLAVAFPLDGSLKEWKELCRASGARDRTWRFPERQDLAAVEPFMNVNVHSIAYESMFEFLKHLRGTGARSPASRNIGNPRDEAIYKLLRYRRLPISVNYDIAYVVIGGAPL